MNTSHPTHPWDPPSRHHAGADRKRLAHGPRHPAKGRDLPRRGVSYRVLPAAGVAMAISLAGLAGCAPGTVRPHRASAVSGSSAYTDDYWAGVLDDHVRGGLVNYTTLAADRAGLDRYYGLLRVTGPRTTPSAFQTRDDHLAYWINAHNALVLLAVLESYPLKTMYDLTMPVLAYEYRFTVDGREMTLADIEQKIMTESNHDVRALFALSRAALGTPRLLSVPYQASILDEQLDEAAARGLSNPELCRIEHRTKSILVWQKILERREDFVQYWRKRRRAQTAYLFNVLLDLAAPARRQALQEAVGYAFRAIPFNRALNAWPPPSEQAAVP